MLKEKIMHFMPGGLIRYLAKPYVSGYSMEAGIDRARALVFKQRLATIDLLGEEASNPADVEIAVDVYHQLISRIAQEKAFQDTKTRPTVSLKLSALVVATIKDDILHLDESELEKNVVSILEHACDEQVELTIDMEDYHWTDVTLGLYKRMFEKGFRSLGTVLQSRLFRTEKDIADLPDGTRIRLCIGIYKEAAARALTDKKDMKDKLLLFSRQLLQKNVYLELATHDDHYLQTFFIEVLPEFTFPEGRLEVQMLLGVPRVAVQSKIISGAFTQGKTVPVRLYVPFAVNKKDSTEYSRRRLIANPDLMSYGVKNILGNLTGKGLY
ncbi:proline dehydrogenase family protein [candidate division CSSED10-310 bacterium]|uniref:Proline dehydrogenase family protein n=1 Tax=candidate division CSSED10-310 bacterium TaxID=2855610 RepID=A0ABV6YZ75_UNCC1